MRISMLLIVLGAMVLVTSCRTARDGTTLMVWENPGEYEKDTAEARVAEVNAMTASEALDQGKPVRVQQNDDGTAISTNDASIAEVAPFGFGFALGGGGFPTTGSGWSAQMNGGTPSGYLMTDPETSGTLGEIATEQKRQADYLEDLHKDQAALAKRQAQVERRTRKKKGKK